MCTTNDGAQRDYLPEGKKYNNLKENNVGTDKERGKPRLCKLLGCLSCKWGAASVRLAAAVPPLLWSSQHPQPPEQSQHLPSIPTLPRTHPPLSEVTKTRAEKGDMVILCDWAEK